MGEFKRVVFEDWVHWVPTFSFGVFFMIFMVVAMRAMLLKKEDRERMAAMPLQDPSDLDESNQERR